MILTIMIFAILIFLAGLRICFILWNCYLELIAIRMACGDTNRLLVKSEFDEARDIERGNNEQA